MAILARYSEIANKEDNDQEASKKLIHWIKETNKEFNIPSSIEQIELKDIEALTKTALKEGNPLYPVPVLMGKEEIKKLYLEIRG